MLILFILRLVYRPISNKTALLSIVHCSPALNGIQRRWHLLPPLFPKTFSNPLTSDHWRMTNQSPLLLHRARPRRYFIDQIHAIAINVMPSSGHRPRSPHVSAIRLGTHADYVSFSTYAPSAPAKHLWWNEYFPSWCTCVVYQFSRLQYHSLHHTDMMDMSSSSSASMPMPSSSSITATMSMSTMQMVFYTSTTTPLYSTSWTPSTTGQYAGTCIFLIVLATFFRALFALRAVQERRWQQMESRRRYIIAGADEKENDSRSSADGSKMSVSSEQSNEGSMAVLKGNVSAVRPWRTTQDVPRACLDVVIAGVGYLL